jgi:hypothetical protein
MRLEFLYPLGSSVRALRRESCAGAACFLWLAACLDQPRGLHGKTDALVLGDFWALESYKKAAPIGTVLGHQEETTRLARQRTAAHACQARPSWAISTLHPMARRAVGWSDTPEWQASELAGFRSCVSLSFRLRSSSALSAVIRRWQRGR